MDKFSPTLTQDQLKQNIDVLQNNGVSNDEIQKYVNNYSRGGDGSYTYKGYQTPTPAAAPKKDFLQSAGDVVNSIFPGKQVGQSIGTLAGYGIAKAKDAITVSKTAQNYDLSAPTPLQTFGDSVAGAAMVSGAGIGEAPESTVLGRIIGTGLRVGGNSALQAAGTGVANGDSASQVLKESATSGGIGAVGGSTGQALGELVSYLTSPAVTHSIYNKATNIPPKAILKGK